MQQTTKRLDHIDIAKAIGLLLVIYVPHIHGVRFLIPLFTGSTSRCCSCSPVWAAP